MVVPRTMLLLVVIAFFLPASASTLEEASSHFISYQFDAGSHHDAPDTCDQASAGWEAPRDGTTDGMLMAPDDVADVFIVNVPNEARGQRLHVAVADVADADALDVTAFAPGCTSTVLDAINWPSPEPSPPAPAAGETQHTSDLDPWHCDSRQWTFVLNELQGVQEPTSIHVAWTNGQERTVELAGRYGNFALYGTDQDLGILLKGAWANVDSTWDGDFALAFGPCDAVDGGAVYGGPPSVDLGALDFTPTRAGAYVVQVTFRGAPGKFLMPIPAPVSVDPEPFVPFEPADLTDGTPAQGLIGHEPGDHDHEAGASSTSGPHLGIPTLSTTPPTLGVPHAVQDQLQDPLHPIVVPATCHWCVGGTQGVWESLSYRLSVLRA